MSTDIPGSWDWQKKAKIDQACLQSFCCCPAPFALRMHPGFNDFAIPSALIETPRESDADGAASLPMIFERRCRVIRALGVPRRSQMVGLARRRRPKFQARTRRSGGQGRLRRENRTPTARHPYPCFPKGAAASFVRWASPVVPNW